MEIVEESKWPEYKVWLGLVEQSTWLECRVWLEMIRETLYLLQKLLSNGLHGLILYSVQIEGTAIIEQLMTEDFSRQRIGVDSG